MGDDVLDQSVLEAILVGHSADREFILDDSHEC